MHGSRRVRLLYDHLAKALEAYIAATSEKSGQKQAIPGVDRVGAMSYIRAPFAGPKAG